MAQMRYGDLALSECCPGLADHIMQSGALAGVLASVESSIIYIHHHHIGVAKGLQGQTRMQGRLVIAW